MNAIFGQRRLQVWLAVAMQIAFLSSYEEDTAK